jgi:neutral ceramidase
VAEIHFPPFEANPAAAGHGVRGIVKRIGELLQQDLILGASHTHSGPVLKDNLDPAVAYGLDASDLAIVATYTNWLRDKIVATIGQALRQATPANAYYGVGLATDLAAYRTPLHGAPFEFGIGDKTPRPEVPVLVFRDVSNNVLATVFSYACHPTFNSDLNYHGDWPGIVEARLEQRYPGSVALFRQGAAGDLNPNTSLFTLDSAGSAMANIVAGVINGQGRQIAAPISTSYQRINLPLDIYNQGITVNDKDQETATHMLLRSSYQPIADSGPFPNYLHARQMLNAIDTYSLPASEPLPIQVWYAPGLFNNPLIMVVTGGEPVVGYATAIKAQTPPPGGNPDNVWVSAYANEVPGYIASDEYLWDWATSGGYESGWDDVGGIQVAAGSQLYYGNPARLLPSTTNSDDVFVPGVEQIILKTVSNMIIALPK